MSSATGTEHSTGAHGHEEHEHHPGFIGKYIFSTDHKTIGIQFLFTGILFLLLGGLLAIGVRWQLAWPYDLPGGEIVNRWFPESIKPSPVEGTPAQSLKKGDIIQKIGDVAVADPAALEAALADLPTAEGAVVMRAPDRLTLEKGDLVVELDGETVADKAAFEAALRGKDGNVKAVVDRAGAKSTVEFPANAEVRVRDASHRVKVQVMREGSARSYDLDLANSGTRGIRTIDFVGGAVVSKVPAEVTSLKTGDVIIQLGDTDIQDKEDFDAYAADWGGTYNAVVLRDGVQTKVSFDGEAEGLRVRNAGSGPMVVELGSYTYGMTGEFYTMIFTMHATIMIFFVIIPLLTGAFGNFLIPLQIGARDMAFPKLNMISYWMMPVAGIIMMLGFFTEGGHAAAGWTSYPPLAGSGQGEGAFTPGSVAGQSYWLASLLIVGTGSILGAVNYVTTIIKLRAPGMGFFRMPLSTWSLFITSILVLFGTPVLASALTMQLLDRQLGTGFFQAAKGGQPLLWQHVFWFYSHPAVYIMILPGMGFVSDIISTFARKPIFGYRAMVYAIAAIAGLGFIVWGHHMFQSGMNPYLGFTFMVSTMMIALPSAIKTFNWLGTIWKSQMQLTPAMLNALAFVSMFVIGGLSGIYMAATPVDIFIHDTYFIVGHIHYVLFGGSLFAIFGAIYYWFPKMFGRQMNQTLGYIHFIPSFIFFNVTFFPMHIIGMAGHPRRIAVGWDKVNEMGYRWLSDVQWINELMTVGAICLGLSQIPFLINFLWSVVAGPKAPSNPWNANSLEWCATTSPAPHGNWGPHLPVVHHGPYEYSSPLVEEDWLPQTKKVEGKIEVKH